MELTLGLFIQTFILPSNAFILVPRDNCTDYDCMYLFYNEKAKQEYGRNVIEIKPYNGNIALVLS